ncbi:hypothetical protein DFH07DRAFT_966866 [Mycena maculata]|uniref:Uncharacterized protein n=1 Tax=Mycena maculata TaxID=230809 RepID=A0AAD7MXC3_9AGAR|nr:hypothetical protein DFH07DRAFT_966857 [Mycena maculata]KAJ7736358.1 hypothetical protein DFH07DRAFT_966866 [Mycena maculata]
MSELRHPQTESLLTLTQVTDIASEDAQEIYEINITGLSRLRRLKEKVKNLASKQDVETLEARLREIDEKREQKLSLLKNSTNKSIEHLKDRINQLELDKPVQAQKYAKLQAEISSVRRAASLEIQSLITSISACLEKLQSTQGDDRSAVAFLQREMELMKADVERIYSSLSANANLLQEKDIIGGFYSQLFENEEGLAITEDRPSFAAEMEPSLHEDPRNLSDLYDQARVVVPANISDIKKAEPENGEGLQRITFEPRKRFRPISGVDAICSALTDNEAEPQHEDGLQLIVFEPQVSQFSTLLRRRVAFVVYAATSFFALGLLVLALWIELQKADMEAHYEW